MTLHGTVRNGVIVFDQAPLLAEGTKVEVVPVASPSTEQNESRPTLHGVLDLAGSIKGMPPDMAEQHDHYLHGTPKR